MNPRPSKRSHRNIASCLILTGGLFGLGPLLHPAAAAAAEISFNRDVRPILSDKCFRCHGPDAAALEGDLRLDLREDVVKERDGYRVITPGYPGKSVLIERIYHEDDDEVMPPADSRSKLNDTEKEILRRWIAEDARYEKHWSLVKPTRTQIPERAEVDQKQNVLDTFVLTRLQKEGMSFSPEASRETLIRRLSIDLTGLPPSIEEIDAFLADKSPDAYGRLVDRLLDSPRYGEKMAVHWLDAARYADTNGYFSDRNRTMWPWRDWVIRSFNENMPFDQFTIEQLAGDMLPKPTQSQLIASGFNRNHMTNNETGIDEEEFRTEYVADRVKTTSMVWMGLTMECARCHDHKYDPISQKDYYRFFAFFNNVPERGLATGSGGSAPLLAVPSARQTAKGEALKTTLEEREKVFRTVDEALKLAQAKWETSVLDTLPEIDSKGLISHLAFDGNDPNAPAGELKGQSIETVEPVAGQMGKAISLNGNSAVEIPGSPRFERADSFSLAAWINTKESSPGCVISKMDESAGFHGFDLVVRRSMVIASLKSNQQDGGSLIVAAEDKLPTRQWYHILLTYDGSGKAAGLQIYLDGKSAQMQVISDSLKGDIATDEPFRVGGRKTSAFFQGSIDEVLIFDRKLENGEVLNLANNQFLRGVISRPVKERSQFEADGLREQFLLTAATETQKRAVQEMKAIRDIVAEHKAEIPVVMVMKEKDSESTAHVLERGEYNQPGEKVGAGVPKIFENASQNPPLKSQDRLDLAKWLVSPENPLTSRVIVNRIWQQLFGTGIVATSEDFGTQGEWPSHPGLLDWLACEFMENGWDVKALLRLIVSSETYRQESNGSPDDFSQDPGNRLLGRGPRFRMGAEMIRDSSLLMGGLLHEKIGGPGAMPYQPPGLWKEVTYDGELLYEPDEGEGAHRRSLYSYWKRQVPPPSMLLFDAPPRETCTVTRTLTNTPLQALVLMNDPAFLEAAQGLAERILKTKEKITDRERVTLGFRLATARHPSETELDTLLRTHAELSKIYDNDHSAARALLGLDDVEDSEIDLQLTELAAWTATANVILSMDETITKF